MIVLSRKKILSVLGGVFLLILVVAFIDITKPKIETVETVSLPVTNKVIILDAGHGVPDERSWKQ